MVVNTASADDLEGVKAIMDGMRKRKEKTGHRSLFIQTSGTGVFVDQAKGEYANDIVSTCLLGIGKIHHGSSDTFHLKKCLRSDLYRPQPDPEKPRRTRSALDRRDPIFGPTQRGRYRDQRSRRQGRFQELYHPPVNHLGTG